MELEVENNSLQFASDLTLETSEIISQFSRKYWNKKHKNHQKQLKNVEKSNEYCKCSFYCTCEKKNSLEMYYNEQEKNQRELIAKNIYFLENENKDHLELFFILNINQEGTVRLKNALSTISFGSWQGIAEKIEVNLIEGVVNIMRRPNQIQTYHSLEKEIEILQNLPSNIYQQVALYIQHFNHILSEQKIIQQTDSNWNNQEELTRKEEEFKIFKANCFNYLKENIPKSTLFVYNIGRIMIDTKEIQIHHSGYSQTYLDLLGIDQSTLSSLLLRRKTIELVPDISDITRISSHTLNWMTSNQSALILFENINKRRPYYHEVGNLQNGPISYKIFTFDGYPLTIYQKSKMVPMSRKESGKINDEEWICEFYLEVIELDVNVKELDGLINYRNRLVNQQGKLSIEDYLRKELSLLFEDVEYSVHSLNFIEKFYSDKIVSLDHFSLKKREEEAKKLEKLRCGIRKIKY